MEASQYLFYESFKFFVGPWISLLTGLQSEGQENIPEDGCAMLISNHRSLLDPILIGHCIKRPIRFAAASYGWMVPIVKHFFEGMGYFPINIAGGRESRLGLAKAYQLLREGELVGIFPEGIEAMALPDKVNRIMAFKTGFVRVAVDAKARIVPVAVKGIEERKLPKIPGALVNPYVKSDLMTGGVELLVYRKARVIIGTPIKLEEYYDMPITKETIDRISGKLRRIVMKLYDGEDLDRFLYGRKEFNIRKDRV